MAEASSTEDVITLRIRFRSETVEKFAERYAADLTPNEIFIRTREPLPVGTTLALEFSLADGSALVSGRGSVAWTREPVAGGEAGPAGMGIRFEALTGPSRQMLAQVMEAKARLTEARGGVPLPESMQTPRAPRPAATPLAATPSMGTATPGRGLQPPPAASPRANRTGPTARPEPRPPENRTPPETTRPPARANKRSEGRQDLRPEKPPEKMKPAFVEEEAEPTELASSPPSFFYDDGSDQEKTRLQDPRASAALLRRERAEAQAQTHPPVSESDDDLTNPFARVPMMPSFAGAARSPAETSGVQARGPQPPPLASPGRPALEDLAATRETKVPTFARPSNQGNAISAGAEGQLTDHHPLILSSHTATQPIPSDVARTWRPTPPASAAVPPSAPFQPDEPDGGDVNWGGTRRPPEPPPPANEPRWGGSLDTLRTLPQVPPAEMDTAMATPGWPAPAMDPHAPPDGDRFAAEEARRDRISSIKTWIALIIAAGGVLMAGLLVLPVLLKSSAPQAPAGPATAPAAGEPKAVPETPAAGGPGAPTSPAAGVPAVPAVPAAAAPENKPPEPKAEPAASTRTAPTTGPEPKTAPTAGKTEPAAGKTAPAARPETKTEPSRVAEAGERPSVRSVRPRPPRRSVRESLPSAEGRTESPEPAAAPSPLAPAPGLQAEGSEEVYWLTVRSIPAGADVMIDGQVEGKTPFVRRIFDPTRSYALTIRRSGFAPIDRTLGTSDVWTKRGNVRTLTVVAKLRPSTGPAANDLPPAPAPAPTEPPATASPPASSAPPTSPPPVEPERKTNPFAEPPAPGTQPPQ